MLWSDAGAHRIPQTFVGYIPNPLRQKAGARPTKAMPNAKTKNNWKTRRLQRETNTVTTHDKIRFQMHQMQ